MTKEEIKACFYQLKNQETVDGVAYVNLETLKYEVYNCDEQIESDKFLQVPFIDELYPLNEAKHDYIEARDIDTGFMSAGEYFFQNGLWPDFSCYREETFRRRLENWFKEKNLIAKS